MPKGILFLIFILIVVAGCAYSILEYRDCKRTDHKFFCVFFGIVLTLVLIVGTLVYFKI